MRTRSPRKPKGAGRERRTDIIAAAIEAFERHGYAKVTTRTIAEMVGLSQTGLYLYFRTKEDILHAIGEQTHDAITNAMDQGAARAHSPEERLRNVLRAYVDFGLSRPAEYQLTFTVGPDALAPVAKDLAHPPERQTAGERHFLRLREHLAQAVRDGVIGDVDPLVAAQILWFAGHGAVSLLVSRSHFPWSDRPLLVEALLDVVTRGLKQCAPCDGKIATRSGKPS